jgi:hypothetical protein
MPSTWIRILHQISRKQIFCWWDENATQSWLTCIFQKYFSPRTNYPISNKLWLCIWTQYTFNLRASKFLRNTIRTIPCLCIYMNILTRKSQPEFVFSTCMNMRWFRGVERKKSTKTTHDVLSQNRTLDGLIKCSSNIMHNHKPPNPNKWISKSKPKSQWLCAVEGFHLTLCCQSNEHSLLHYLVH